MYVGDLDAARLFFCRYFGARSNQKYHNPRTGLETYFLCFDDGVRLEIMRRPETVAAEFAPLRRGYIHIAFSVGSKANVDNLTRRLENDGYAVLSGPRTTGDGYYESSVLAFENNIIEITE